MGVNNEDHNTHSLDYKPRCLDYLAKVEGPHRFEPQKELNAKDRMQKHEGPLKGMGIEYNIIIIFTYCYYNCTYLFINNSITKSFLHISHKRSFTIYSFQTLNSIDFQIIPRALLLARALAQPLLPCSADYNENTSENMHLNRKYIPHTHSTQSLPGILLVHVVKRSLNFTYMKEGIQPLNDDLFERKLGHAISMHTQTSTTNFYYTCRL